MSQQIKFLIEVVDLHLHQVRRHGRALAAKDAPLATVAALAHPFCAVRLTKKNMDMLKEGKTFTYLSITVKIIDFTVIIHFKPTKCLKAQSD